MRRFMIALIVAAGCRAPSEPPASQGPSNAMEYFHHFIDKALSAPHVFGRFEGSVKDESGHETSVRGVSRRHRNGILLVDVEGTGQEAIRLMRIGDRTWIYKKAASEWVAHEGSDRPGSGFQDPFAVMSYLEGHRGAFKQWHPKGQCGNAHWDDFELEPAPPAQLFQCLVSDLEVDNDKSRLRVEAIVEVRGVGQMVAKGKLVGSRGGMEQTYQMSVNVLFLAERFPPPPTLDEVPQLTPEMKALLDAQGGKAK